MIRKRNRLICGWGINDVDYCIYRTTIINHNQVTTWIDPYYKSWLSMLRRVFDIKMHKKRPNYVGCTVHEDWKYLSNFIKWVDSQPNRYWEDCQLDKDFLVEGNKHYGPDTCVYIPQSLNIFITNHSNARGPLMLGVCIEKGSKKNPYIASCSDPFKINTRRVGSFSTELEAHKAWQAKKHEYACMLADLQDDPRVAKRLCEMYSPDKDWSKR